MCFENENSFWVFMKIFWKYRAKNLSSWARHAYFIEWQSTDESTGNCGDSFGSFNHIFYFEQNIVEFTLSGLLRSRTAVPSARNSGLLKISNCTPGFKQLRFNTYRRGQNSMSMSIRFQIVKIITDKQRAWSWFLVCLKAMLLSSGELKWIQIWKTNFVICQVLIKCMTSLRKSDHL